MRLSDNHYRLGTGLFKSNISPLVAEQYKRTRLFVITTKSGERVIVDPALTISRVYMVGFLFRGLHHAPLAHHKLRISIFISSSTLAP